MLSSWRRKGNFYSSKQDISEASPETRPYEKVEFKNIGRFVVVAQIDFQRCRLGTNVYVRLQASPFCFDKLLTAVKECFQDGYSSCTKGSYAIAIKAIAIKFDPIVSLNKFITLFATLNQQQSYKEFPPELIDEFKMLADPRPEHTKRHCIPEIKHFNSHVNPELTASKRLIKLLTSRPKRANLVDHFHRLLIEGEDPNQDNPNPESLYHQVTPLYHIVYEYHDNHSFIPDLIRYGADPFFRCGQFDFMSPIELAYHRGETTKFNLMISATSSVEKPLPNTQKYIKEINMASSPERIMTVLHFNNDMTLVTTFTNTNSLSPKTKGKLFNLFNQEFEMADREAQDKQKETFDQELTGENKYIEIIYHQDRIVGFNTYHIKRNEQYPDHVINYHSYSAADKDFRGFMLFLGARFLFAMQLVFPEKKVGHLFCTITYKNYVQAEQLLHFPKYQPDYLVPMIRTFLQDIYKENFVLHHHLMTCYVEDVIKVKGRGLTIPNDIFFTAFNEKIRGGTTPSSSKKEHAVPVFFYATQEVLEDLTKLCSSICAERLDYHIHLFKDHVRKVIGAPQQKQEVKRGFAKQSRFFWNNEVVYSDPAPAAYLEVSKKKAQL